MSEGGIPWAKPMYKLVPEAPAAPAAPAAAPSPPAQPAEEVRKAMPADGVAISPETTLSNRVTELKSTKSSLQTYGPEDPLTQADA